MATRIRDIGAAGVLACAGLLLWSCQTAEFASPPSGEALQGRWQVQQLEGVSVEQGSRAFIEFSEPPRLLGSGGCNRFFGVYRYEERRLQIEAALGSTKMACGAAIMLQEQRLFRLLPEAVHAELSNGQLHLRNQRGDTLLQAIRMEDRQP